MVSLVFTKKNILFVTRVLVSRRMTVSLTNILSNLSTTALSKV
jgi:hypothetical protein